VRLPWRRHRGGRRTWRGRVPRQHGAAATTRHTEVAVLLRSILAYCTSKLTVP
jgi:hypothetical protein